MVPVQPTPDVLLTQQEAAKLIGVEPRTLEAWRARGSYQLPFVKIGPRIVRYRLRDLEAWIEKQTVTA